MLSAGSVPWLDQWEKRFKPRGLWMLVELIVERLVEWDVERIVKRVAAQVVMLNCYTACQAGFI